MNKIFTFFVFLMSLIFFSACSDVASVTSSVRSQNPFIRKSISTYFRGSYVSAEDAIARLKEENFKIVATYHPVKDGTIIIFTNKALLQEASKPGCGYIATLRLFIDEKNGTISITNPVYFGKAFMGKKFDYKVFVAEVEAIHNAFPDLHGSKDSMEFENLASYHFMIGMPYYKDQDILAQGSAKQLIQKLHRYKDGRKIIFQLKITKGTFLIGYELEEKTRAFIEKLGRENAAILPWSILIENKRAKAINAQYYLAISYPLLKMSKFMSIATVPGRIKKELTKPF